LGSGDRVVVQGARHVVFAANFDHCSAFGVERYVLGFDVFFGQHAAQGSTYKTCGADNGNLDCIFFHGLVY